MSNFLFYRGLGTFLVILPFLCGLFLSPLLVGEDVSIFFTDDTEVTGLHKSKSLELSASDLVDKTITGVEIVEQDVSWKFRLVAGLVTQVFGGLSCLFMCIGIFFVLKSRKKFQRDVRGP